MVKRPDIAEELCQETFLKAWRYWPPKNNKNLYGWLHLIATNIVRDTITNGHLRIERGEVLSFDFSFFTEEDITHDIEDTKQGDITEHCARNELRQQAWNGLMAEHKQALARYQVRQPVDMKIVFHARKAYKDRYKRLIRQSEVAS